MTHNTYHYPLSRTPLRILAFALLMLTFPVLRAQTIRVEAPQQVQEGDQFTIRFVINEKSKDFRDPNFGGLQRLSGPGTSSSFSMKSENGKTKTEITTSYTYLLQAPAVGDYTIGSAQCKADGKQISSQPFTIKVVKADPNRRAQQQQQQSRRDRRRGFDPFSDPFGDPFGDPWGDQQAQQQQAPPPSLDEQTLYARATVSKNNLYEGEQAIVVYKIYTQVPVSQYQIDKLPGNKGFWAEDLTQNQKEVKQYEETINGKRYQVAEIRRGALFAQETGQLRIAPLDLDVLAIVQQQRRRTGSIFDLFDDPFFNRGQAVERHLKTNAITVNVKPLPPAPDGFCGGVGQLSVKADADTRNVRANEAITYRITISGQGNLMHLREPKLEFSNAFEVYDPQIKDQITRSDAGISGSRTFEWVVIPRAQGKYEIPAVDIATFNPKTGQYENHHIDAIPLEVAEGDPNATPTTMVAKNDVKVKSDINYIKTTNSDYHNIGELPGIPIWLWIVIAVAISGTIATITIGLKQQANRRDVAGTRLRRATREARKRLKQAAKHLSDGNDNAFYEEIYKAIWGCLADKYNIPLASLSSDTVRDILVSKQVQEEQQEHIMHTLADVDYARFAPGDSTTKKQQIYDEALTMIASL